MQTVTMEKGFLLNLDDARKTALREKIANKEISLDIIETPQNGEMPKPQNTINFTLNKEATPLTHTQYGELLKEDVKASMPSVSFGDMGTPDKSEPKFKASKDEDGDVQTYPASAKVGDEIGNGVHKLETTQRPDVDGITKWKRGLLAKTDDLKTNVANAKRVFEQGGYNLVGVKANEDGFATQSNVYKLEKDGNEYIIDESSINSSFWDMGGDPASSAIALGTVGIGKAIGLGAIGNMIDQAISKVVTGEELTPKQRAIEVAKEAALFGAGETVVKGIGKAIELPKQARDFLAAGNINGAKEVLKKSMGYTDETIDAALEAAKGQYKEVDGYVQSGVTDITKQQEALLAAAQADKKFGSAYIHDAVLDNKDAAEAVSKTIDTRSKNLINSFEDVAIDGTDVKRAVEGYEKQVGDNYEKMRDTFKEAFKNVDYAFDLSALKTDEIMRGFVDDIVNPYDKDVAKNLITKVEKIVGDKGGMTRNFDNLVELRQAVNDFWARGSKSMGHDAKVAFGELKKNIDNEIYSAIDKNIPQEMQKPLKDMFDGAIEEYKEMYAIKDTKLYKTVMDDGMSADARMDALIRHTADDEMEFATLLKKLPAPEQAKIENSITKAVLDKNIIGEANELQAIDYNSAVATLGKLEDFMVTPSGKESVKIIKDMAQKFGDDIELLKAAKQGSLDTNAGIATTLEGRIKYKLVKNSFDRVMRLVPFSDNAKRAALQKHIADALAKSRTPMDMAKRVAGSEDVAKADKADLLDWARDFNRANSLKNEQQAQKLLLEIEAKEAAKAQADAEAKAMFESFDSVDGAELLAVQKLGGYDALAQTVKNLQNPTTRTVDDVKKFVEAKAKIDPKRLESMTTNIKYPLKDADAKIEKLLQSNVLDGIVDETTLKVLRYDIKGGKLRNEAIEQKYKEVMKIYDEVSSVKPPEQLLREKQSLLNESLRKMKFEESVDDLAAAAVHRENAAKLQEEVDALRREMGLEVNPNAETRISKPLSSQAQAAKDIADMNYHNDEDEAAKAVKDLFKKNKSEEKSFKNMSEEDLAEYERVHGTDTTTKQKSNEIVYDEDGEVIPFANPHIGSGVVAGSGNALEYDEEGNLVGFDTEKFVTGFLAGTIGSKVGALALKKHNPKLYNKIVGVSKEFPNMATANPKLLAEIYKTAPTTKGQALMFAGEKAIKADIGKLDDAMKLMDDGASEADVWKKTGWFKGDDGKWRFEIDDSTSMVNLKVLKSMGHNDEKLMYQNLSEFNDGMPYVLGDVLKHEKLFKAYPELENMPIKLEDASETGGGYYSPVNKFIALDYRLDTEQYKEYLMHEIQHAVQDIEKFDLGHRANSYDGYKKQHVESEARITENSVDMKQADRKQSFPYDRLDVNRDELTFNTFDLKKPSELGHAKVLEERYIDKKTDLVKIDKLIKDSKSVLPQPITSYDEFKKSFQEKDGIFTIQTPIGKLKLEPEYAYSHLTKNWNNANRFKISGAFADVYQDPLFVVRQDYKQYSQHPKSKDDKGIFEIVDSYGFYKAYEGDKDYHIVGFSIDENGNLINTTFYNVEKEDIAKIKKMIKVPEKDLKYFRHPAQDKLGHSEQQPLSRDTLNESIAKDYKDSQGFYSVLEKTIDEKVGGKIDSSSLKNMLEKNGVKQDEIEWSGLKELMESKEKLTREEIEETINANRLVVEVVEKTDGHSEKIRQKMVEKYGVEKWMPLATQEEKDLYSDALKQGLDTKYKNYTLDGGENYRELLFTKPSKVPEDVKFIRADDGYWYAERPPYDGTNVISSGRNSATLKRELTTGFKSSHWDESNILVFTRVDDRKIDGKDTLFVEELQSDWHQGGRKEGYKNPEKEKRVKYLEEYMKSEIDNNPKKSVVELFKNSEYKKASEELLALKNETRSNIPNAPFKKNWHELGLKRMVQEAVANDYDKIAWTTGKQQAERYSLEKTVDTVVYNKDAGVIQATNGAKEVFFKRVANEQEIEDIMGKELTARLLDKKNTTTDGVHVLQGEELKFGGEGMQAFYDEIVPNAAKKLFKKWGVKPKMEELDDVEQMVWSVDITPAMKEDVKKYGQPLYAVGGAVIANEATKGEEQ